MSCECGVPARWWRVHNVDLFQSFVHLRLLTESVASDSSWLLASCSSQQSSLFDACHEFDRLLRQQFLQSSRVPSGELHAVALVMRALSLLRQAHLSVDDICTVSAHASRLLCQQFLRSSRVPSGESHVDVLVMRALSLLRQAQLSVEDSCIVGAHASTYFQDVFDARGAYMSDGEAGHTMVICFPLAQSHCLEGTYSSRKWHPNLIADYCSLGVFEQAIMRDVCRGLRADLSGRPRLAYVSLMRVRACWPRRC